MRSSTPRFLTEVTDAVARIEARTDAEIVVVVASKSGSYRDIALTLAASGALILLVVALAAPFDLHPVGVIVELTVAFLGLGWLLDDPRIAGRLATNARKRRQARDAAESEFVREAIHGTPHRTGILVYISDLERRVEVIPDLGAAGMVPPGELAPLVDALDGTDTDRFVAGLTRLGDLLARRIPHRPDSDDFDLPNTPRMRT